MIKSLFPKTKRSLLALMFLHPEERFYIREIEKLTQVSQGALQRELKSMVEMGILQAEKKGRQTFYFANKANPIYSELHSIVFKTFGVADVLKKALKSIESKIETAFIYGSVAKDEDTARSDIDLFIISDIDFGNISVSLSKYEETLGRPINLYTITPNEFKTKLKGKNHFISSVIKAQKIMLIGSEDDIRRLGK
jgi:predicted nucleotidyltransferase